MRISKTLDEAQPLEQVGFRKDLLLDRIQKVSRIDEACLPLVLILVDYEKVFDSVETNATLWRSSTKEWTIIGYWPTATRTALQ
ncbi:unnamed protein product, partial [Strongylus vulgaris]